MAPLSLVGLNAFLRSRRVRSNPGWSPPDGAVARVRAMTLRGDPDWRVLARWQRVPSTLTEADRGALRGVGEWAKSKGWFSAPARLVRVVSLPVAWRARFESLGPRDLLPFAEGMRSWSTSEDGLESFGGGLLGATFVWNAPDPERLLADGDTFEEGLRRERPALYRALRVASSRSASDRRDPEARAGFDVGEYLAETPAGSLRVERVEPTTFGPGGLDSVAWLEVSLRSMPFTVSGGRATLASAR